MNRTTARAIIATEGARRALVVYFTKRDGTARRMVCRFYGATSRRPHLITVWDMEKGAARSVNLDTVQKITVLGAERPERRDRPAIPPRRSFEDFQREIQDLF